MKPIFQSINLLHADDCPMMILNKSLDLANLELNKNLNYFIKLASVGIIKDKNVSSNLLKDNLLLTKRNRNLSIFPRAW